MKVLQTALSALTMTVRMDLAHLASAHNILTPFHQIPDDLLTMILLQAVDFNDPLLSDQLVDLGGVGRRWKNLIELCPQFWSHIHSSYNKRQIDKFLERSKNAPLRVDCSVPERSFLGHLLPAAHRCRTLFFDSGYRNDLSGLDEFLSAAAPSLSDLTIAQHSDDWEIVTLPDNGRGLRRLVLEEVGMDWNPLRFPILTSLTLTHNEHDSPSTEKLLDVLSSCPLLEVLILQGWYDRGSNYFEPRQLTPGQPLAHLPHLRVLHCEPVGGSDSPARPANNPNRPLRWRFGEGWRFPDTPGMRPTGTQLLRM